MKKFLNLILIVVVLGSIFYFPLRVQANQIPNPSFETDTSGWSLDSDYVRSNEDSYSGSWSVKQTSTSGNANFTTANDATGISVTANVYQTLSFYAKVTVNSGNPPIFAVNTGSAFGSTIATDNLATTNGTWQIFAIGFNPGAQTKVWLRIFNNGGNITAYYDNFDISTPVAPTLPPYIKSIDVMKYTKDVICAPLATSTVDTQLDKIVEIGATYVSISGFYDDPVCNPDLPYLTKWAVEARSKGLKIWWRMKDLSFEGDYSITKATSPDGNRHKNTMITWLKANASLIHSGDMFTPFAEIQNGGIQDVTFCASSTCQFSSAADFNKYIRELQIIVPSILPAGVYIGYYGFDGFVAAGLGNPDHSGTSYIETDTRTSMGEVAIDHYPEAIGSTFAIDLPIVHTALGADIPVIIGEYGTIDATSESNQAAILNSEFPALQADNEIVGFNYWNLGPVNDVTGEGLVKTDYSNKAGFTVVQTFFGEPQSTIPLMGISNASLIISNAKLIIN